MNNDQAVSEIIGTILIIILVVALTAVIAALFMGLINLTPKSAFIAVDMNKTTTSGKEVISMFNRGGDTAYLDSTGQQRYQVGIYVNDTTKGNYRVQPPPGVNAFSPGTTLLVFYNSSAGNYTISNSPADLASADYALPGGLTSVRLVDENAKLLIAKWDASAGGPRTPPVASFFANATTGCMPLTVKFIDSSTGTPTIWNWSFGDGNTSSLESPVKTYRTAGTYTVSLTAGNSYGNSTPATRTGYIGVGQLTVVNFTPDQTSGCLPLTVKFTDTSTGTPTSWNWTFGDGGTSTVQSPVYTYTSAGNFTVGLTSGTTCPNTTTRPGLVQAYGNIPAPVSEAGGFWYLNDGSASDSSGHGNTGTITNGTWVHCPAQGRAYLIFNGSSTYVAIPNSASLSPASQVSFEAWIYPVEQKTAKIIQKRDWDGHGIDQDKWQGWQGGVTLSDGTKHDITWFSDGKNHPAVLRTWSYVVLTYDGVTLRIYVNGVERNSIPLTGTLNPVNAPVVIGSTGGAKFFNGSIANVAVYSRALNRCEIATRYAAFHPQGCV